MRNLETWLEDYSVSHRHPTNKMIHNICVPIIMFTILGMMWAIPVPEVFKVNPFINWATFFISLCMIFYFSLGIVVGLFMVIVAAVMLWLCFTIDTMTPYPILKSCFILFILAWIGQFAGHKIEGKKPSFFKDLQFLLVGPLWVFHPWYAKFLR